MNVWLTLLALAQPPQPTQPAASDERGLAFTPDASALVFTDLTQGKNRLTCLAVPTGKLRWHAKMENLRLCAHASTGTMVVAAGGSIVESFDSLTGKRTGEYKHSSTVTALAVGPETYFATATDRGEISIWDRVNEALAARWETNGRPFDGLAISADGNYLAAIDRYSSVDSAPGRAGPAMHAEVWDIRKKQKIRDLTIGPSRQATLAFSPDGQSLIFFLPQAGFIIVQDLAARTERYRVTVAGPTERFAYAPTIRKALSLSTANQPAHRVDLTFDATSDDDRKRIRELIAKLDADAVADRDAAAMALSEFTHKAIPDLVKTQSESPNPELRLRARKALNAWQSAAISKINLPVVQTRGIALSNDGKQLATYGTNDVIKIFNLSDGKAIADWKLADHLIKK